jgi:hypothetical protein
MNDLLIACLSLCVPSKYSSNTCLYFPKRITTYTTALSMRRHLDGVSPNTGVGQGDELWTQRGGPCLRLLKDGRTYALMRTRDGHITSTSTLHRPSSIEPFGFRLRTPTPLAQLHSGLLKRGEVGRIGVYGLQTYGLFKVRSCFRHKSYGGANWSCYRLEIFRTEPRCRIQNR